MKLIDVVTLVNGSAQFRIDESSDGSAPIYYFYGQAEIENDLIGGECKKREERTVRTYSDVSTLKKGDVIFSLISGKAAIVSERYQNYLHTQNYVRLRTSDEIDDKYLVYLLNEDADIKRQFRMSLQGTVITKYTKFQLNEIKLPKLPNLNIQKTIGEIYLSTLKLNFLKQRVAEMESKLTLSKLKEVLPK